MLRLRSIAGALVVMVVGLAAACGSDDDVKKAPGDDAGAAGEEASGGGPAQGGSSSQPEGGVAGEPASAGAAGAGVAGGGGGEPALGGAGGVPSEGGAGGALEGGAGPGISCPITPATFEYSCGEARILWSPYYDTALNRWVFDLSEAPYPIQSGTATYMVDQLSGDGDCGEQEVQVAGDNVIVQMTSSTVGLVATQITNFDFTDVCGNTYAYDPIGTACTALEGRGGSGGNYAANCAPWTGPACPAACD